MRIVVALIFSKVKREVGARQCLLLVCQNVVLLRERLAAFYRAGKPSFR